jgi:uncharacterized protein YmfQ (DUF2313 family)
MRSPPEFYRAQLQALLPLGAAWPREEGVLTDMLSALAEEFARVDGRGADLLEESDPRTTTELLAEWERAFGLPDPCTAQADTYAERIADLVEKVTRIGGQSRAYFIALAARLGYTITLTEFDPFTVESVVEELLYDENWQFAWRVNAPAVAVTYFTTASYVTEPLADWGNERLECVINRVKPAHTIALFAYA